MCTVTWLRSADGFHLLSNRDELRTRPPAEPPIVRERDGVRWIAPRDPQGGGTWIAVDDRGVALTLLNGAADGDVPPVPTSRGQLVSELATAGSAAVIADRLGGLDLSGWRAFGLFATDLSGDAVVARWEAGALHLERSPRPPLVSSSFRPPEIRGSREALYAETTAGGDLEAHLAFHRSHRPEKGARSPCMHRPEARSVSFSWISVGDGEAVFRYADGPPCRTPVAEAARIPLRPAP